MEKTENATKVDGVSAQINMGVGSETHLRFARLMKENGAASSRAFIEMLLDAYENPKVVQDLALEFKVQDLQSEINTLKDDIHDRDSRIGELESNLEEAKRVSNENAEISMGKQNEIDEMLRRYDGAIVIFPNPVVRFFLEEMSVKTGTEPGKILEKLFIDDLQNPMANNLPYVVPSSRIRGKINELKSQQQ